MRDDAGRDDGQADEQASSRTAGGAAWRFAPLVLIAGVLVLCFGMGWHRYMSLAWLADSRDMLRAYCRRQLSVCRRWSFVVLYVLVTALSFPGRLDADDLRRLPVRLAAGRRSCASSVRPPAPAAVPRRAHRLRRLPARPGRRPCRRFLEGLREGCIRLSAGAAACPFVPFFVVNIAPALCGVRPKVFVAATAIGILPGALAYSWLGQGLDSVLLAAKAAGRHASIHDLVTPEITIAFAGLALVALLAAVVRRRVVRARPENAASARCSGSSAGPMSWGTARGRLGTVRSS